MTLNIISLFQCCSVKTEICIAMNRLFCATNSKQKKKELCSGWKRFESGRTYAFCTLYSNTYKAHLLRFVSEKKNLLGALRWQRSAPLISQIRSGSEMRRVMALNWISHTWLRLYTVINWEL